MKFTITCNECESTWTIEHTYLTQMNGCPFCGAGRSECSLEGEEDTDDGCQLSEDDFFEADDDDDYPEEVEAVDWEELVRFNRDGAPKTPISLVGDKHTLELSEEGRLVVAPMEGGMRFIYHPADLASVGVCFATNSKLGHIYITGDDGDTIFSAEFDASRNPDVALLLQIFTQNEVLWTVVE